MSPRALRRALLGLLLLPPASAAEEAPGAAPPAARTPFGLVSIDREHPISIRSAELEAVSSGGARELVFTGQVEVEQADLRIRTERLKATYPEGASQPESLVATGGVVLTQQKKGGAPLEARCDEATYERSAARLWCTGHALLKDGENEVRGQRIEFDLEKETVRVTGGAAVVFQPRGEEAHGS